MYRGTCDGLVASKYLHQVHKPSFSTRTLWLSCCTYGIEEHLITENTFVSHSEFDYLFNTGLLTTCVNPSYQPPIDYVTALSRKPSFIYESSKRSQTRCWVPTQKVDVYIK